MILEKKPVFVYVQTKALKIKQDGMKWQKEGCLHTKLLKITSTLKEFKQKQ